MTASLQISPHFAQQCTADVGNLSEGQDAGLRNRRFLLRLSAWREQWTKQPSNGGVRDAKGHLFVLIIQENYSGMLHPRNISGSQTG
jgi:hypothetical protein